jgi:hypothetical protein
MVNKILRGLAVAAGTGLAIGLGFAYLGPGKRRRRTSAMSTSSSDSILMLEPILDRLDRIEARLSTVEARPVPAVTVHSTSLAELDLRIQEQTKDIEALQVQMSETRQRVAAEAAVVERRFAEVTKEVPVMVESIVEAALGPRVEDLRARLHAEMLESVEATLARFEQTIDSKVSLRIATIEKALTEQSAMITALSQREVESDAHLQRLISAVERLCERTDERSPVPTQAKEPSFRSLPFERQLDEAMERVPDEPRVLKEETPVPISSRWRPRVFR